MAIFVPCQLQAYLLTDDLVVCPMQSKVGVAGQQAVVCSGSHKDSKPEGERNSEWGCGVTSLLLVWPSHNVQNDESRQQKELFNNKCMCACQCAYMHACVCVQMVDGPASVCMHVHVPCVCKYAWICICAMQEYRYLDENECTFRQCTDKPDIKKKGDKTKYFHFEHFREWERKKPPTIV